jgi:peptidoglycan/LPS O-acetylase OafA/YrhL
VSILKYRPDIDGLRALAVLSVVIYHIAPSMLPGGFLGVDIFFVISGYLISLIVLREQMNGTFRFNDFYSRRILRLFPALVAVLMATIAFGALSLFADEYARLGSYASWAAVFLTNIQLMHEAGYFDVASNTKPLLHLWSLSVEEQFYLVWPALIILLGYLRLRIGLIIVIFILSSFIFTIYLAERNIDTLYFHPLARFWELMLGAILACWQHWKKDNVLSFILIPPIVVCHLFSVCGMTGIILSLLLWNDKIVHPGGYTLLPVLSAVAYIASGSGAVGNRLLSLRPFVWIGLISYPLYLWHWPVLSYIRIMESLKPDRLLLWVGGGVALVLAALTYRFIEQPLRRGNYIRMKLLMLGSIMMTVLITSRIVVANQGFPNRTAVEYEKEVEVQMTRGPRQNESCLSLLPVGNAPVYCLQHAPGKQMIAIIGDSHAHVLFPGVAAMAAERGYGTLLLANSGCPVFDGAVTGRNSNEKKQCAINTETILSTIEHDSRIVSVLIASRGPQYLDGKGFGPFEGMYMPIVPRTSIDALTNQSPINIFRSGLDSTIKRLHDRGISVAYLLQVPELEVLPKSCLRPLTITRSNQGCEVAYEVYQERMRAYRSLINEIQASRDFLRIVDPESIFCNKRICSGFQNDRLLYADNNHLSILGSYLIAPEILRTLNIEPSFGVSINSQLDAQ